MKTSLNWLADFLPQLPGATEAAEALTHGGLPVEMIDTVGDDTVLDIEVTSNRSDCLSHRGVARELAALLNLPLKLGLPKSTKSRTVAAGETNFVTVDDARRCPMYVAQLIRGVRIGPSPAWMQKRLTAIGLRPVNNVVDITNYVMFEFGQPLHAFDFAHVDGGAIHVRLARQGETLTSIDGHERKMAADMLVIADRQRPIALAGVMGGRDSEVTDGTTDILLESARFDPLTIRKTARALAMKSESSYRFERGIDPQAQMLACQRASAMIVELAGGECVGEPVVVGENLPPEKRLTLRAEKLLRVLGAPLESAIVADALKRLGFSPVTVAGGWSVTVPTVRLDVNVEIDLVEEVARVVGYQHIPIRDTISVEVKPADETLKTVAMIRNTTAAGGYSEAITVTFVGDTIAPLFTPAGNRLMRTNAAVRKADGQLRPSLLPGLLEAVRRNESVGTGGAKLFEIGSAFWIDEKGVDHERRQIAIVGGDFPRVRGMIQTLLEKLNPDRAIDIRPTSQAGFATAGTVIWGDQPIGVAGLIDSAVGSKLGLRDTPAAAQLDLQSLIDGTRGTITLKPLPRFPAIQRDLSLVISESVSYARIAETIQRCALSDLQNLAYVTTYRGKPLEKGTKSVTVQFTFRSPTETLTADRVDAAMNHAVAATIQELKAAVRA